MNEKNEIPIWQKQNLTIKEAAKYSQIGETKLRELTGSPLCTFALHIGKRTLIKRKAFDEYISKATMI